MSVLGKTIKMGKETIDFGIFWKDVGFSVIYV
jgi:hypothetical protein